MSSFKSQTGKSIQACFEKFHQDNPEILNLILKECNRAIVAGKKKFSIKAIGNYIRWNIFIETKETTLFSVRGEIKKFRLNDAYFSRYARLIISLYPHMEKYIELRDLRATEL